MGIAESRHRQLLDRMNRSWRAGIHRLMAAIADGFDRAVGVSQGGDRSSLRLAAAATGGSPAPGFATDALAWSDRQRGRVVRRCNTRPFEATSSTAAGG